MTAWVSLILPNTPTHNAHAYFHMRINNNIVFLKVPIYSHSYSYHIETHILNIPCQVNIQAKTYKLATLSR